jgi:hypothetical protein
MSDDLRRAALLHHSQLSHTASEIVIPARRNETDKISRRGQLFSDTLTSSEPPVVIGDGRENIGQSVHFTISPRQMRRKMTELNVRRRIRSVSDVKWKGANSCSLPEIPQFSGK